MKNEETWCKVWQANHNLLCLYFHIALGTTRAGCERIAEDGLCGCMDIASPHKLHFLTVGVTQDKQILNRLHTHGSSVWCSIWTLHCCSTEKHRLKNETVMCTGQQWQLAKSKHPSHGEWALERVARRSGAPKDHIGCTNAECLEKTAVLWSKHPLSANRRLNVRQKWMAIIIKYAPNLRILWYIEGLQYPFRTTPSKAVASLGRCALSFSWCISLPWWLRYCASWWLFGIHQGCSCKRQQVFGNKLGPLN